VSNNLITNSVATRIALRLARNSNSFIKHIDTQYSDDFARAPGKIGSTLRIRKPVDYVVRNGPTAVQQNTVENYTTLVVNGYKGVDMGFTSVDRSLSVENFTKRYIAPAVNNLVGAVATDVMSMVDTGGSASSAAGAQHFVHNVDGSNNTTVPTAATWLQAGAILDANSADRKMKRMVMLDPLTQARTVSGLSGFYNPQMRISDQTETGLMQKQMLGFDWYNDQTTIRHTTGSFTAGTVNGANQTGTVLAVNAITGTLNVGDLISIAGVNSVNSVTKVSNGSVRTFTVTAAAASGATSINIWPAIIPSTAGAQTQYQTVDVSPANGAAITLLTKAGETYRKNLAFVPEAFTLATVDLDLPTAGVVDAARESYDGISMRMITYFDAINDVWGTRLDILYGYALLRPEWVVAVGDAL
jgi:hypothetical protein